MPAISYVHYLDVMTLDAKGSTSLSVVLHALITSARDQRDTRHLLSHCENRALPAATVTTMTRETLTRAKKGGVTNLENKSDDGPPYFCRL